MKLKLTREIGNSLGRKEKKNTGVKRKIRSKAGRQRGR